MYMYINKYISICMYLYTYSNSYHHTPGTSTWGKSINTTEARWNNISERCCLTTSRKDLAETTSPKQPF